MRPLATIEVSVKELEERPHLYLGHAASEVIEKLSSFVLGLPSQFEPAINLCENAGNKGGDVLDGPLSRCRRTGA